MHNKLNIYVFAGFMAFIFMIACSKVPSGILSEKKMKEVLIDMHLAEAMINSDYKEYNTYEKKEALYKSVFDKHGVTEAEYDTSLVWYGRNLDIYMRVYDGVIAELNAKKKALGDIQPDAAPNTGQDSVNIWNRFDYLTFSPYSPYNGVYFNFVPQGGYRAGSSFVLALDVWGLNKRMTQAPEVRLSVEQSDTTFTAMRYLTHDGLNELMVKSLPLQPIKRVYGYIRLKASRDRYYKIYVDSIRLMRYNYGTNVVLNAENMPQLVFPKDTLWADSIRIKELEKDSIGKSALKTLKNVEKNKELISEREPESGSKSVSSVKESSAGKNKSNPVLSVKSN